MDDLLFLVHRIPYPPNKGDKIRSYHLLRHLAANYRVHLATFIDDPDDRRHVDALRGLCADLYCADLQPIRARLRSLGGLARGEALSLPYYRDAGLRRWVTGKLAGVRRVLAFSSPMAQYVLDAGPGVRRVMDFVDVDSDKWRQYSASRGWPMGWLYRREARRLLDFERRVAHEFDACVLVSAAEAELFRRLAPEAAGRIVAVENGVDSDYFSPDRDYENPYDADERVLVFTGAMDYWANVDAVNWFAREIFPGVQARHPMARFYVVGSRPTDAVHALGALPGVRVTGRVADTRPYIAHARAAVAPLRIARGVQNKVLEAMAMARPVLASPQAMDGIAPCAGLERLVGDSAESLARLAEALITGDDHDALGPVGRACVLSHYDWERNLAHIDALLEGAGAAPRRRAGGAR
ncbi:MAG TPA: TIGR03087 family PEP-CTERM/XrtA system glycosyltransferase [Acidiferrobacterales bacterium]